MTSREFLATITVIAGSVGCVIASNHTLSTVLVSIVIVPLIVTWVGILALTVFRIGKAFHDAEMNWRKPR